MRKVFFSAALCLFVMLWGCAQDEEALSATEIYLPCDVMQTTVGSYIDAAVTLVPKNAEGVEFFISDESVLKKHNGRILAINTGEAVVTAVSGNVSDSMTVKVEDITSEKIQEITDSLLTSPSEQKYIDLCAAADALTLCESPSAAQYLPLLTSLTEGRAEKDASMEIKRCALLCAVIGQHKNNALTMSFVGDCTFASFNDMSGEGRFPYVYDTSGSVTYPFDEVKDIFFFDSATVINFEGTLTKSSVHPVKEFYFKGDPTYARILPLSSVEAACLANNHTGDFFQAGLLETREHIEQSGVKCFYEDEPCIKKLLLPDGGEVQLALLGACSIDSEDKKKIDDLAKQVEEYHKKGFLVSVSLHWGVELSDTPEEWQRAAARKIADAGADIITGHHPHVVQGIECYNGTYIAYSLGNFAFGGNTKALNPETLILRACFEKKDGRVSCTGISAVPCLTTSSGSSVNNYKPCPAFGDTKEKIIDMILDRSKSLEYGISRLDSLCS